MSKYSITADDVSRLIRLDEETGKLWWRHRDESMFSCRRAYALWNGKHAFKEAFTHTDKKGYKRGNILSRQYTAHSIVWLITNGYWHVNAFKNAMIDHINGDKSDNRPQNLRLVDDAESARNRPVPSCNTSGHIGVTMDKSSGKWKAHIKDGGKQVTLGRFASIDDAIKARVVAEKRLGYHGNHGRSQA